MNIFLRFAPAADFLFSGQDRFPVFFFDYFPDFYMDQKLHTVLKKRKQNSDNLIIIF